MAPDVAIYVEHLGMAYLVLGRNLEAEDAFKRALKIQPDSFGSLLHLGCIAQNKGRQSAAESYFVQAIGAKPDSVEGRLRWGVALLQFGDVARAEEQSRIAIGLKPDAADCYELLASVLAQKGDSIGAVEAFEKALSLGPRDPASVIHGIVSNKKVEDADRPLVDSMRTALASGSVPEPSSLILHVALGKSLDDLGDYEGCMRQFGEARKIAGRRPGVRRLDRAERDATVRNYRTFFPKEVFEQFGHWNESELPVFVVGMPRSGTTLLEQVLSSHPDIAGAGEIDFWRTSPIVADPRLVFEAPVATDQASRYLKVLTGLAGGRARAIDKTLPNYALLGPLHILFPKARFIHCRRHPVDTCLSILMNTLLLADPPEYVYDLGDMVYAYRAYLQQMEHWRQVLPGKCLLELDYEDLVTDREGQARRIVEFCGLPWNDACLHHEQNDRPVNTPSKWQVRQPLYGTSVERWRRYEPWLGPLRDLLDGA